MLILAESIAEIDAEVDVQYLSVNLNKRLLNKGYDVIRFRNGYAKDSPTLTVEYKGLQSSLGIIEWGAPEKTPVYILKLGKILGA